MKKRFMAALVLLTTFFAFIGPVQAQTPEQTQTQMRNAWIQVEANPTLRAAEEAVRIRSARLADVAGFRLPGGWYAVAIGPFTAEAAAAKLQALKAAGEIPGDSFIMFTNQYGQQFWPVGAAANPPAPAPTPAPMPAPVTNTDEPEANNIAEVTPEPAPEPEETVAQARASERQLNGEERRALQIAMQWQGYYNSGIDGAFGPGTRKAMADWQAARGYEPTGVLTTRQRAQLLDEYQAEIASLGLTTWHDEAAGIEMALPLAMVAFDHYEAPFAHYKSINDSGVRVVLISQSGDQNTLFGLYDIMQSLRIVPLNGARERKADEFTITGDDAQITSYTYVKLVDGAVKGFTLIWPKGGDERLREMALEQMRASFTSIAGVALADDAGLDQATQSIDLMSGLEIRRPTLSRSGFYVAANGTVLTTAEVVADCTRISIDEMYDARLLARDEANGLAVLVPEVRLAPLGVARLRQGDARIGVSVAVAGYPFEGALSAPTLTFGTLADIRGLGGEENVDRFELIARKGDVGGPVLGPSGAVIAMLAPRANDTAQRLPDTVNYGVKSDILTAFLAANGVSVRTAQGGEALDPVDLSALAADMSVLVSCWN